MKQHKEHIQPYENTSPEQQTETNTENKWTAGLLIVVLLITAFNAFQIVQLKEIKSVNVIQTAQIQSQAQAQSPLLTIDILPKAIPQIYGSELGVSFDDVSASNPQKADATIKKLGVLDQQITLTGEDLQRYIKIASQISCEYCCGAKSIIFENGQAACGCAHSYAMRGLAKYLIKNHASEYTDDQILEEMGKWKTLFFPGKLQAKAQVLKDKGIELNYINLASNKYRGIEAGAPSGGQMVGGC